MAAYPPRCKRRFNAQRLRWRTHTTVSCTGVFNEEINTRSRDPSEEEPQAYKDARYCGVNRQSLCGTGCGEREVTSERIRDKIGASKRKGLWVGGKAAFGYEVKDHKIVVVENDAESVRTIFRSYLKLGSINLLVADLRERKIVTKVQALKSGRTIGGIPFTSGPLGYLLRNRFYIGEVVYKGEVLPGEQTPIVDRNLFEAVQAKLAEQQSNHI